jgi:hypothetical protein
LPEGLVRGVTEALLAALKDKDENVRYCTVKALEALSARLPKGLVRGVTEALLAALKDADSDVRQAAAQALEALGARLSEERVKEVMTEALLAAMKDKESWSVREAAVKALEALSARLPVERVKEVTEALLAALKDKDSPWVRQAAAKALEALSARLSLESLQFLLNLLLNALNNRDFDKGTHKLLKILDYLLGAEYLNKVVGGRMRSSLTFVAITPVAPSSSSLEATKPTQQDAVTLPDGNCTMNAVSLGICDLILQHKEPLISNKIKTLLDVLNPILIQRTGSDFLSWLERETDSNKRQSILAPILRALAVEYIESHVDYYKDSYEAGLLAAFQQYKFNQLEDTFSVHSHIRKKFAELNALANIRDRNLEFKETKEEQETQALLVWWNKGVGKNPSGFQEYLNHLKLPARGAGDRERWGSEVEIGALAFRLGVTLKNVKPGTRAGQAQLLGIGYGCVLGLSELEIEHLVNLGIGSRFQGNFRIEIADIQELTQKLQLETLTEAEKAYLDKNGQETVLAFMGNVRNCPVPERAGMQELCDKLKRIGLFVQSKNQPLRFVNDTVLNSRLTPVNDALKKKVLAAHIHPPCFAIQHIGAHWSYLNKEKHELENRSIRQYSGSVGSKDLSAVLTFNRTLPPATDRKASDEKERYDRWAGDEKENKNSREEKQAVTFIASGTMVGKAGSSFSFSSSSMSTSAAIVPLVSNEDTVSQGLENQVRKK